MNHFWKKLVIRTVLRHKHGHTGENHEYSSFAVASGFRELRLTVYGLIKDYFLISLGVLAAAFGLESFLLPAKFIDGGATGVALLFSQINNISLSLLLIIINIPFIIFGYNLIGKQFAIKASIAITGLSLVLAFMHFPHVADKVTDKILLAGFGGFFLGLGIGLTVRGGAVLDGTEILAIVLSKRLSSTIGDIIIMVNILVFSAAGYFLSIETALYSMVAYLSASRTLDFVIEGIEEYTGVTIISAHSDEMRLAIIEKVGRGVTIYSGKRGYGSHGPSTNVDIIFTVITRLEIRKLTMEVEKVDPNAFVVMNSIKDTKGGMIKKRRHSH